MNLFTENQFSQQPFESHSYSVTLWRWIHNFRLEWTHSEMEAKTMHAWLCKQINVINVIIVIWTLNQLFRLIIITIVVAVLASFLNWVGIALMTSTRERESEKTIKNRDTTIEGPKVIYRKCVFWWMAQIKFNIFRRFRLIYINFNVFHNRTMTKNHCIMQSQREKPLINRTVKTSFFVHLFVTSL